MTLPENLRVSPLLRGAAPDTLRQLAAQAASRTLPRTAALWRSGDPVVCAFILLRGEVRLTRPQAGGRSLTRPVSGAGEVLGLRDVLGAAGTFAEDAVGSAPHTDLLALPGAALRELIRRDPALADAALTLLAEQLGTVPELVSRHLGDLYRQGLIGLRRREIVTLDEPGLRRRLPG
ncbi:Crp/Fnr family transcriptional regulator [Deinococcus kurensis]|uniref:Crp/Fnr family transcriptional regulator n=1 Tax=Deinococcus kurensis TaxID=2662757 RepID=UPI0013915490|nr:helix-turn-helix domain-containing protein [Deinococcus kurensis]